MGDLEDLKAAINKGNWEVVHIIYDELIKEIAEKADPEALAELDEITKDVTFWYA